MKILYVTPNVPSPIRPRPLQLIKHLGVNHEVHVVCLVNGSHERQALSEFQSTCASVTPVIHHRWQGVLNCLRALPTSRPLRIAYFTNHQMTTVVEHLLRTVRFDLVHIEHWKVAVSVAGVLGFTPSVFDAVDCVSLLLERQEGIMRPGWRRRLTTMERRRTELEEAALLNSFTRVVAIAEADCLKLRQLGDREVSVVPNGVDTEQFRPRAERDGNSIVFAAKLDYFPNARGAEYLVREVMPLVWSRCPDARLAIVGSAPPRHVRALASDGRVKVTGFVPNIGDYLSAAAVVAVPILAKAGMQNKLLEALACGAPTVASTMAVAGLDVQPGEDLMVASDAREFAFAICDLLESPSLRKKLSTAGPTVARRYSWEVAVQRLEAVYGLAVGDAHTVAD